MCAPPSWFLGRAGWLGHGAGLCGLGGEHPDVRSCIVTGLGAQCILDPTVAWRNVASDGHPSETGLACREGYAMRRDQTGTSSRALPAGRLDRRRLLLLLLSHCGFLGMWQEAPGKNGEDNSRQCCGQDNGGRV